MQVAPDLCVASIERSVAFYRDVLGFAVPVEMPGPDGRLAHAEVRRGEATITFGRLEWLPEESRTPLGDGMSLYLNVGDEDIDAYYARLRSLGATVAGEIAVQFWGDRHFRVADPDGYRLSLAKTVRQVGPRGPAGALAAV